MVVQAHTSTSEEEAGGSEHPGCPVPYKELEAKKKTQKTKIKKTSSYEGGMELR